MKVKLHPKVSILLFLSDENRYFRALQRIKLYVNVAFLDGNLLILVSVAQRYLDGRSCIAQREFLLSSCASSFVPSKVILYFAPG